MLHALLASLPSPSTNTLGPLPIRAYGVMIALGVVAAVWLSRKRWAARGGDPEDVVTIALWAVPAGLIGARLYHVATDWKTYFPDDPLGALAIWKGGLGIPGGLEDARSFKQPCPRLLTCRIGDTKLIIERDCLGRITTGAGQAGRAQQPFRRFR